MKAIVRNGIVYSLLMDDVTSPEYLVQSAIQCPDEVQFGWTWDGVQFAPPPAPPAPSLDDLKKAKRDEAKSKMDAFLAALQPEYGQYSIATWDVQAQEADGLLTGTLTEAECPGLAALVAGRVVSGGATLTVTEQAQRIKANRQQWRLIGLFVEGQRNGIMDRVQASTTPEQVQAIEVSYSLHEVP